MDTNSVTIIIPVVNEEGNMLQLVKRIDAALLSKKINYEMIFIDDHSTDKTAAIIKKLSQQYRIRLFTKIGKKGKAYSLLEGFSRAKYDVITIIDADLQYPPEAIPAMLTKISEGADVVVANRRYPNVNLLRKVISKSFLWPFGKLLHGFDCDIQSGLKVFKKEIIERITLTPGPWSFDLEFLIHARAAGYKIDGVEIDFSERKYEKPKISLIPASFEIGLSAIKLKLKSASIIPFHPQYALKKGKGFHYKGIEFIHHSNLNQRETAFQTLTNHHKMIFGMFIVVLVAGFIFNWHATILLIVASITGLYFFDLFFNLFLIVRNFTHNPEIHVGDEELSNLDDSTLPKYTILCPLYREWEVLPQFIKAISALDYPKDKLQVLILLEEDDKETLSHTQQIMMPNYFETVVIGHSLPKTKPKALNYGLQKANGEYVVIYDAEDIPDTKQLKKAIIAFKKAGAKTACIQAKLNFYNPHQNILTRVFTAEYSLWFDLVLTGLQSISAPIPLGGTSNHFKTVILKKIKGWDSFNVTEDCDLGVRLMKKGYNTALIHSVTLEEANSDLINWFNQRSRWIKGYIQTYLVHMRQWNAPHFFSFQLIIGGKILSMFINPFMWLTTILYFSMRSTFGVFISQFFPGPILYIGVISLVVGNFLYMYYYMIGCAKRGYFDLIKYAFLVPFYWLAMSVAAWQALIQLIQRPHFWPKTIHGFHIDRNKALTQAFNYKYDKKSLTTQDVILHIEKSISASYQNSFTIFCNSVKLKLQLLIGKVNINKTWNLQTISSGSFLVLTMMIANLINFLINAFFGRILTFNDFGLLTLLNALLFLYTIITGSLSGTVNHRVAYLTSKVGNNAGRTFFSDVFNKFIYISVAITLIWIISVPFISKFFNINDNVPLLLFTPVIAFGLLEAAASGYLRGSFMFVILGLITLIAVLAKFAVVLALSIFGINSYSYLPLILTSMISFGLVYLMIYRLIKPSSDTVRKNIQRFPKQFFVFNCINSLSTSLFLTVDILLVNHFLAPTEAGKYAFLSLAGKMVLFLGSTLNGFIFSFIGRDEGLRQNTKYTFFRLLFIGSLMTGFMYLFIGVFGYITMPVLFGSKTYSIIPYLNIYTLAVALFTISNIFLNYEISKKRYHSAIISLFSSGVLIIGIGLFHKSIWDIVFIILLSSFVRLTTIFLSYIYADKLHFTIRNLRDFAGVFKYKSKISEDIKFKKRILIFNWRDTRHSFAGGAEVYIHELAKRWVKLGCKVTLFCGNDSHAPSYEIIDGVEIIRRGGFYFVYVWAFLYYILKFRNKYDIIIDSENGIPFFTPLYSGIKKYLLIHHVHQEVFMRSLKPPFSWLAIFLETKFMPFVYKNVEAITVSPSSKKDILDYKLTSKEPTIIYNGVDLSRYKPGQKNFNPLILYIGRLKFYKSLNIFIKSACEILKKFPNTEFVIAGDGEEKTGLMRLTNKLGLGEKIKFLGRVTEEQKIALYQKAWVFVNPSFMEGWGITTIEANACGTPVVAADVPGLRDSVRNPTTGILVPHGNINKFSEAIIKIMSDQKFRKYLSEQSIIWATNFDWEKSAKKSLELFL